MVDLMNFDDVLRQNGNSRLHALLGNGFSRACRNDLFSYSALFESAKDRRILSDSLLRTFGALGTNDFEFVMRQLASFEQVVDIYAPDERGVAQQLRDDVNSLRDALAKSISANHPERADEIPDSKFMACRAFLRKFDHIFTLNYDLLLYWAMMKNDVDGMPIKCDDGFRPDYLGANDYVAWSVDITIQNVYYLHGALHIFDGGHEVQKYTWSKTGIALVDQIRLALEENRYPVYVAEGSSESKWEKILHSSYLIRGYRSLSTLGNSLVVFGHSLHSNDNHVLARIERSKVRNLYISIFGNPDDEDNLRIQRQAQEMAEKREQHNQRVRRDSPRSRPPELEVHFFDAASAKVWG